MAQSGFTPILTYASNTASSVPAAGNLTNSANGAELAVNTADRRLFVKNSGGAVVELGTNPSSLAVSGLTASQAVFTDGSKNLVSNAVTGTGNVVMSTSPVLITPNLGTPSAATLTNATGLPLSTGVTGTLPVANGGTGQTTAQAAINSLAGATTSGQYLRGNGTNVVMSAIQAADVPTLNQNTTGTASNVTGVVAVANGGTGVTTSTGTGSVVLSASPALTTPNLGTPSAATLTNATGLPLSTGVTGTLPATNGGTGQSGYTTGDIIYASGAGALSKLAIGTTNQVLASNGTVPQWVAPPTVATVSNLNGGAAGSVPYQSATNVTTFLAIGSANSFLVSSGSAPQWSSQLQLDTNGNLGLGVAPSASWGAGAEAFQISTQGQSLSALTASSQVNLSSNAVFNGTDWLYGVTAASGRYQIDANTHAWFRASSGTAGNAITYTQGMTLDSSGRLLVNTSSVVGLSSSQKFQVVTTSEILTGSVARYSNNTSSCVFYFFKSRGATIGTSASVNQGDGVAILGFSADTGSQSADVVRISTYVDGPVTGGSSAIPGGISIGTGAGVSSTPTVRLRIDSNGCFTQYQAAESAQNTSATLTVAQLRAGIITSNAAVTLTLPTGTDLETYTLSFTTDTAFECVFIATTANAITIAANGNTTVGNLTVSGNTSGTFRFRKTNTNTFTVYRVA